MNITKYSSFGYNKECGTAKHDKFLLGERVLFQLIL